MVTAKAMTEVNNLIIILIYVIKIKIKKKIEEKDR